MTIMAQAVGKFGDPKYLQKKPPEKETIHSGHFMVSDFEAEAQDDGDELAVPLPEEIEQKAVIQRIGVVAQTGFRGEPQVEKLFGQHLSIETSLTKLFRCMSLAYRQKLTSPKWNRFKGIRLRWKDKIRLNNVIWRCWHMQFIGKKNSLVCQFASPLDVDTHNKPEAVVLEGKYWKRKLSAVTAEYKKWRMYYRNQVLGCQPKDGLDMLSDLPDPDWPTQKPSTIVEDGDYMEFEMPDTLFSTITLNQPFAFPDTREIARGAGLADFIQPSLVQLQPNLEDFMDTLEPLQDLLQVRLAPLVEETGSTSQDIFKTSSYTTAQPPAKNAPSQMQYSPYNNNTFCQWYTPPSTPEIQSSSQFKILPSYSTQPQPPSKAPIPPITSSSIEKQTTRREEVFVVGSKTKTKPRSQSGPCGVLQRKDVISNTSTSPLISAVSDSALQPNPTQPHNSALLAQLLTNNSNVSFSCIGNESGSTVNQVPTLISNQLDNPFVPSLYRPLESTLIYQPQSELNKSQGQYTLTSDCKRSSSLVTQGASPAGTSNTILISPTPSPLPSLTFVSTNTNSPDSPASDPLSYSPKNVASPSSSCASPSSVKITSGYKEHRRVCHINAEQKRRCNIKNGFDTLHCLIPQLNQYPNTKLSKAVMLQKGADYIKQLRNERNQLKQEIEHLRQQIDALNSSISNYQAMLPATGAPVSKQRNTKMRDMFQQYVRLRTHEDWKFWILSLICDRLLMSFSANVSTASLEELCNSTLQWVEQHCTLADLRPIVLNALRQLSTSTEVLTDPSRLPLEAKAAVDAKSGKKC